MTMKIFLDLGAWTGNSIARFGQLYPDHEEYKIYSFEAHPDSAKRFKINYPKIKLIDKAVWTEDCRRTLRVGDGKWIEGCSLIKEKKVKRNRKNLNVKVSCIDFVKWMRKHLNKEDYIVAKFNIEGAEYKVIQHIIDNGMIDWFDELWVEWHWSKMGMTEREHLNFISQIPQDIKHWELDHKRKAIYTVITNPKYKLIEPLRITEDWDYVCISSVDQIKHKRYNIKTRKYEDIEKSEIWQTRYVSPGHNFDQRKLSRKIKILHDHFMPGNDVSIYMDTRFCIKYNLNRFVEENLTGDIAVMRHNKRNCLFKEGEFLLEKGKLSGDDKKLLSKQLRRYKNWIKQNYGLWAPGIMIRKHGNPELRNMMRKWYEEMLTGSHRDIVSFPFAYKEYREKVLLDEMEFKRTYENFIVREGTKPRIASQTKKRS